MEKIAMKCTRAEYESIKEFVGELENISKADFVTYNYLTICSRFKTLYMVSKDIVDLDKKIYETFDKDVFLNACGIKISKVKINLLDAEEALGKDTMVAINTRVKKDKKKSMLQKAIKQLKDLDKLGFDIQVIDEHYGYTINSGEYKRDGSFTITITGNKTK
jgi:hypothetical protein